MKTRLIQAGQNEPNPHGKGPSTDATTAPPPGTGHAEPISRPTWVRGATPTELLHEAERAVGDRYRIESLAGEGGMGRIFSARDTTLGRRVAIKLLTVLDPGPGEDPAHHAHNRLVAEARAMARLNHPNLCRVVEVSLAGDAPYLVMDWADGAPFDRHCRRLGVRQRLTVLLQVLDAAGAMHHEGLAHGDLKPSNILIGRDGRATIVDFGLARAETEPSWNALHGGTPGYAAPELLTGATSASPEADVFAAGVLLYEVLTERSPFPRNLAPAVMADLLARGGIPLPEEHAPDTPADLQKICLVALEVDPRNRYPDAAAMAADIRRYLRRETVAARPRILETRFDQQVESQLAQAAEWRRLGLITPKEGDSIARALGDLQRAESPWIIDARRLRASHVSLYLGGWILLLGLIVGISRTWPDIPHPLAITVPWILAGSTLALGLRLHAAGEKRVGIGMLLTAQAAIPAALWLSLRLTGSLAGTGAGMGPALEATQALGFTQDPLPIPGLANAQMLAVAGAGLALAATLRSIVRSAAFTFFGVIFSAAVWLTGYLVIGGLGADLSVAVGRWGAWLALLGAACIPLGLVLDRSEHQLIRELGRRRAHRRDATPVLCGSIAAVLAGLSATALIAPNWYMGRPVAGRPALPDAQAWAFAINGIAVAAIMFLLARRSTPLRRRVAHTLRWIVPTHLMAPLLFMEVYESWGVWTPWIILLPVVALAFCFASALKQWKPFLFSGLACLAVWYARGFDRIDSELAGNAGWRIGLTTAFLLLGPCLMLIAWRAPAWVAGYRLRRWALQSPRPPSSRRARTWR